ncbi:MAG: N-acetylmuramoyl-L-alanine amidase [Sediminibacterium sp.]
MLSSAYYFLQVVICSALMMGYYWLVLRNKRFHQYNRFYLLAVLVLSWLIPLIKIQWNKPVASSQQVINFLSLVADGNAEIDASLVQKGFQFSWETTAMLLYLSVSAILLGVLVFGLIRLYRLIKQHACKSVGEVYLILTQLKGTPFSFFRFIFWHESIDLKSEAGKQMLAHELTHVQQKHSIDKVLIQMNLVAGWFNPFFWLLKKEMEMIHEFIADNKAINNGDTASLAQMLLTAAYPQQHYLLTTPFFFSPIKRRLQMISNKQNPKFTYMRRLIILPVLAIMVVLFAFRTKDLKTANTISVETILEKVTDKITGKSTPNDAINNNTAFNLKKIYTVVIDAGHGGQDKGATSLDGLTTESQIDLALANAVVAANQNSNIKIVLTRNTDLFQSVVDKANFANTQKADLFISLHCNQVALVKTDKANDITNPKKGIEIYIANKQKAINYEANLLFANQIANSIKQANLNMLGVKTREKGIWVLQSVNCPSVLVEAGFITNASELKQLKDPAFQANFAKLILGGIENYLSAKEQSTVIADTIIMPTSAAVAVKVVGQNEPLMILDGKKIDKHILDLIDPKYIESIDVLKNESAKALYGEEGKNGVILITTKVSRAKGIEFPKGYQFSSDTIVVVGNGGKYNSIHVDGVKFSGNVDTVKITTSNEKTGLSKAAYYIDGIKSDSAIMSKLNPTNISSINILKGKNAIEKYGAGAANGVIEVHTKQATHKIDSVKVSADYQINKKQEPK